MAHGRAYAIALRLETTPQGLSQGEARRRLERDGPNQLAETPPTSPFVILLHQFRSPLIYILLAATLRRDKRNVGTSVDQ